MRNEKSKITTDTDEIHEIISNYFKNLHAGKLENSKEMDTKKKPTKEMDTYIF